MSRAAANHKSAAQTAARTQEGFPNEQPLMKDLWNHTDPQQSRRHSPDRRTTLVPSWSPLVWEKTCAWTLGWTRSRDSEVLKLLVWVEICWVSVVKCEWCVCVTCFISVVLQDLDCFWTSSVNKYSRKLIIMQDCIPQCINKMLNPHSSQNTKKKKKKCLFNLRK